MTKQGARRPSGSEPLSQTMRRAIAANLVEARRIRGWSIRELALRSGLSKALISRLERGEANPSLETLWQLVGALGMPFSELIREARREPELVRREGRRSFETEDENMAVELITGTEESFELYELTMPPNVTSEWHSHGPGTLESSLVLEGRVEVEACGRHYSLEEGDMLTFPADGEHTYRSGSHPVRLLCVMRYTGEHRVSPERPPEP